MSCRSALLALSVVATSCGSSGGSGGSADSGGGGSRPAGTGGSGPVATGGRGGSGPAATGGAGPVGQGGTPATGGTPNTGGAPAGTGGSIDVASPETALPTADTAPAACGQCAAWGTPATLGRVAVSGLNALSGLAASWRTPGVVYVHNDRNVPEVIALDETAALVARLPFMGATGQDFEDIEVSRCPAGTCIYLADIGNNITSRMEFPIYRATEPDLAGANGATRALAAERFAFRYADEPHNAESLLVDSNDGSVYVVTKLGAGQKSAVYRLMTFTAGQVNVAMKVADLPVPAPGDQPATAGTAHPCGGGFLLRTNNTLYEFRTPLGTPLMQAFAVTPTMVPVANEQQGEAVSYHPNGRAYYTTSEGASPPIDRVSCK